MKALASVTVFICLLCAAVADDMYVFGSADQNTAYTFMSKVGGPLANKKVEKVVYSNSEQSGQNFAIALTTDGEIYGWGANWGSTAGSQPEFDGIGSGPIPWGARTILVPIKVTDRLNSTTFFGNTSFRIIDVSFGYSDGYRWAYAFVTSLNEIWTWGIPYDNNHLGTGVTTLTDSPMRVNTPIRGPWKQVLVGGANTFLARSSHMVALSSTGVVVGWGSLRSCSLGFSVVGSLPPSILRWYRTDTDEAPEVARISTSTTTAICTSIGELYVTRCGNAALRINLPDGEKCHDLISFPRGHRVITETGRLFAVTDAGVVTSARNGVPFADSNFTVLANGPTWFLDWDFVYGVTKCPSPAGNCTPKHEFWMRFSSDLLPLWPGQIEVVDGTSNGVWLRGKWTPPDNIFDDGNVRQISASAEAIGVLLRDGSVVSVIHPATFYQQGVQGLGSTDEHNALGRKIIPPAGVAYEKFFVTDNPGIAIATDGRVFRWSYFGFYYQSYVADEIPVFRNQPSKVAHVSFFEGNSLVFRFENGSIYLVGAYCERFGVGSPCTDNPAADYELKQILVPEPVIVSWVWMAATANGTIYAWGDMSPTGDTTTPAVMPRGEIPDGDIITHMTGYTFGNTIFMLTNRGKLFVMGTINSRLMGFSLWANFTDSPTPNDGPRLVPTSNFFNESILHISVSWNLIAVVTSKGELWVITRLAWVFPYDEIAPDPNFWYKLDPSGQGWKVLDVRVSNFIMALVEDPSGKREWWSFGNNLCQSMRSYAPMTATSNLVDPLLKNWTRIDTSGVLFGKTIKDIQLYHPTWSCGTYIITEPFSVVPNTQLQVRDTNAFLLRTTNLGRLQQDANVTVSFSGACLSNLTCSQVTFIDTSDSSSILCSTSRFDVAKFCSAGPILASITTNGFTSPPVQVATRIQSPSVLESLNPLPFNAKSLEIQVENVLTSEFVEVRFNQTDILCIQDPAAVRLSATVVCRLEGPSMTGPALGAQVRVYSSDQNLTSSWYPTDFFVTVARLVNPPSLTPRSGVTQFDTVLPVSSRIFRLRASGLGDNTASASASIGGTKCSSINVQPLTSDGNTPQTVTCVLEVPLRTTGSVLGFVERSGGRSTVVPVALLEPNPSLSENNQNRNYSENAQSISFTASNVGTAVKSLKIFIGSAPAKRRAPTSNVSCEITSFQPNGSNDFTILCSPASELPIGSLSVAIERLNVLGPWNLVGSVVSRARVIDTSPSVTLATNVDKVLISGSNFAPSTDLEVLLFPQTMASAALRCNIASSNATSVECLLPSASAIAWRGLSGLLQVNVTSYGGLASQINVAQLIAPPTITLSNARISINDTTLRISGSGFASPNWVVTRSQVRIGYENTTEQCVVQPESTSMLIVCTVSAGLLRSNGSLFAIVNAHGGWSDRTPIGIVGVDSPSNVTAGFPEGGIAGIVIAILVVLGSIILFVLIRARRRAARGKLDEEIAKMADDMRGMFNVKMSDVEVLDKLGEGSFGVVYLVHYKGRDCALKQLSATVLAAQLNEFFREASLQLSLKPHRNIVGTIGMSQERGRFSLLMELITNGALDSYLRNEEISPENPLSEEIFFRIGRGIAAGMRALTKQRVIHRDLAARNILLGDGLEPKVSDFGFSRVVNAEEGGIGKTVSTVGPIRWMAPESISRQEYSEKSDVWAYGGTLIEMLTGKEPYPDMQIMDIAIGVRDGKFTALDFLPQGVQCPEFVRDILRSCFASNPVDRPTFNNIVQIWNQNTPAGMLVEYDEEDLQSADANRTNKTKKNNTNRDAPVPSGNLTNKTSKKTRGNYEDVMGNDHNTERDDEKKKHRSNKTGRQ